jgi:hypothetical protein
MLLMMLAVQNMTVSLMWSTSGTYRSRSFHPLPRSTSPLSQTKSSFTVVVVDDDDDDDDDGDDDDDDVVVVVVVDDDDDDDFVGSTLRRKA